MRGRQSHSGTQGEKIKGGSSIPKEVTEGSCLRRKGRAWENRRAFRKMSGEDLFEGVTTVGGEKKLARKGGKECKHQGGRLPEI